MEEKGRREEKRAGGECLVCEEARKKRKKKEGRKEDHLFSLESPFSAEQLQSKRRRSIQFLPACPMHTVARRVYIALALVLAFFSLQRKFTLRGYCGSLLPFS